MERYPDEIIVRILNSACYCNIFNLRLINLQFYRCSFSCESFIAKITTLFKRSNHFDATLFETLFKMAKKIPTFDFTVNDNYIVNLICKFGSYQDINFLIEHGVDIRTHHYSALQLACSEGNLGVVRCLVQNGADIHNCNDWAFLWASEYGHIEVVRYLFEIGANTQTMNDYALWLASMNGHIDVVRFLIHNGANVSAELDCALALTCRNGHLDVVRFLVENGADIHARNNYCFNSGTSEVIEYLKSLEKN